MFFARSVSDSTQVQQDQKKVVLLKFGLKQVKLYHELKGG
jgi:hypothetical protein